MNAGPHELDLAGGIAGFLGAFKRFEGFVVILAFRQRPAEVKIGQRAVGLSKVLDGIVQMAEKKISDAQFQMPFFGGGATRRLQLLLEKLGNIAKAAILRAALGQPVPQLLNGPGIAVFPLDQQGTQINHQWLGHAKRSPRSWKMDWWSS